MLHLLQLAAGATQNSAPHEVVPHIAVTFRLPLLGRKDRGTPKADIEQNEDGISFRAWVRR